MSTIVDNEKSASVLAIVLVDEVGDIAMELMLRILWIALQPYCLGFESVLFSEELPKHRRLEQMRSKPSSSPFLGSSLPLLHICRLYRRVSPNG